MEVRNQKSKTDRIEPIQVLRAIAFILIFVSHYPFKHIVKGYLGAWGVSIFICMTGFLIAIKKDKYLKRSTTAIVINKIKKFYPLHVVTFIMSLPIVGMFAVFRGEYSWIKFAIKGLINLSMLQAFIPIQSIYFSFNSVSWYLSLVILFAFFTKPILTVTTKLFTKVGRGGDFVDTRNSDHLLYVGR